VQERKKNAIHEAMMFSCSLNAGLFGDVDEGSSKLGNI